MNPYNEHPIGLFGSKQTNSRGYTVLKNHNIDKLRHPLPKPCNCKKGGRRRRRSQRKRRSRRKRRSQHKRRSRRRRHYRGGGHGFNQHNFPTRGLNWKKTPSRCKQRGGGPDSRNLGGVGLGSTYYGYDTGNSLFRGSYPQITKKTQKQCGGRRKSKRRRTRRQRGGSYKQYQSNVPLTPSLQITNDGGWKLATPPTFKRQNRC